MATETVNEPMKGKYSNDAEFQNFQSQMLNLRLVHVLNRLGYYLLLKSNDDESVIHYHAI